MSSDVGACECPFAGGGRVVVVVEEEAMVVAAVMGDASCRAGSEARREELFECTDALELRRAFALEGGRGLRPVRKLLLFVELASTEQHRLSSQPVGRLWYSQLSGWFSPWHGETCRAAGWLDLFDEKGPA
jgi:hypothetical protein